MALAGSSATSTKLHIRFLHDVDGTLIYGDIGEGALLNSALISFALYAQQRLEKFKMNWKNFGMLLKNP